jgi:hypothetical protein
MSKKPPEACSKVSFPPVFASILFGLLFDSVWRWYLGFSETTQIYSAEVCTLHSHHHENLNPALWRLFKWNLFGVSCGQRCRGYIRWSPWALRQASHWYSKWWSSYKKSSVVCGWKFCITMTLTPLSTVNLQPFIAFLCGAKHVNGFHLNSPQSSS